MTPIPITTARKDLFKIAKEVVKYNTPQMISTKEGPVVLVSGKEWSGMVETIYLESIPGMKESIIEGMNTPIEDCYTSLED